ncbi:MAG: glycosyltransferase family 39 protein [Anaerolineae bacterium]|nr:glycosyltransferase family 39 protein [Anaerolineae bacterium]
MSKKRLPLLFSSIPDANQQVTRPITPLLWFKLLGVVGLMSYLLWLHLSAAGKPLYWLLMLPGWSLVLLSGLPTMEQVTLIALVCYAAIGIIIWIWRYWRGTISSRWFLSPRIMLMVQVAGLLLIIAPLVSLRTVSLFPDETSYLTWGLNLATGQGYTELGEPVLRRGPIHAALLAISFSLFQPTPDVGLLMPKLLGLLNLLLIYWLGRLLFNSWAGFIGAALAAGNSLMMFYFFGSHMLDNTLALFVNLSLLTFYLALSKEHYGFFVLVGVWQAVAVLTKALGAMWIPLPWLFLLISPKFQQPRNFVGAWLSTTTFLLLLYPWLAYVYYSGNQVVLLEGQGDSATAWLLLHGVFGLYLGGGLAFIAWQNKLQHFFQTQWANLYAWRHQILITIGGLTLSFILLSPVVRLSGNFSRFTLALTLEYFQVIVQPSIAPFGLLMLLAWLITLLMAWRTPTHRLLALALLLPLPIYLLLSLRGWQVRNFFSTFLLSYLLLGHYLVWLGQWLVKTVNEITSRRVVGWFSVGLFIATIGLMLAQTVSTVTSQVIDNHTHWQIYQTQSPYRDLKGQLTSSVTDWITSSVPPGTPLVTFEEAWPQLTYFRLGGQYPMVVVPFERMNAGEFKSYLSSHKADKIVYIQHVRDSFPIFNIFPEKKLYHTLQTSGAEYLMVGGKHMSLLGVLDFFHTHPAFTKVYQTELNRAGIAIFKVDLEKLVTCQKCPTVIDDWSWYHLESLSDNNWGITPSELVEQLGGRVTLAYQPNLLDFAASGISDDEQEDLTTLGLARDAKLYLDLLQNPDTSSAGTETLLIEAYINLAHIYAEAKDTEQALLALHRAVTLNPALADQYDEEINRWSEDVITFYTIGPGQSQNLSSLLEENLPLLSWEIYQSRGQSSPDFMLNAPEILSTFLEQYQNRYARPPDISLLTRLIEPVANNKDQAEILAKAFVQLGDWYSQQPNFEDTVVQATEAYSQAFSIAPADPDVQRALLSVYTTQNNTVIKPDMLTKVLDAYEDRIRNNSTDLVAYNELAIVYTELKRPDDSLRIHKWAVEANPVNPDAYIQLGQAYAARQEPELAAQYYQQALTLAPERTDILILLTNLYYQQERVETAINLLQGASAQEPSMGWPHIELGKLYLNLASERTSGK